MGQFWLYLLAMVALSIGAALLPKLAAPLKVLASLVIKQRVSRCVHQAERRFVGNRMGTKRKAWVLDRTQKYNAQLEQTNDTIDAVIEKAVAIMKASSVSAQASLKTAAAAAVSEAVKGAKDNSNAE